VLLYDLTSTYFESDPPFPEGDKRRCETCWLKLGEAKGRYPAAWRLIDFELPEATTEGTATFSFALNCQKLLQARRRKGRYLLRTKLGVSND